MYMVQQPVTTAVREGYGDAGAAVIERQLAGARQAREWLAGLAIDADVQAWLVEPIAAVEEALAEAARRRTQGGPHEP